MSALVWAEALLVGVVLRRTCYPPEQRRSVDYMGTIVVTTILCLPLLAVGWVP